MSVLQTPHLVVTRPLNTHVSSGFVLLLPAQVFEVRIEFDGTTSNAFDTYDDASFPEATSQFMNTSGHMLDLFLYTNNAGLDLWIDEAVHAPGGTPPWCRTQQFRITPGVPQPIRGLRMIGSAVKVTFANGTGVGDIPSGNILVTHSCKVRSS